LLVGIHKGVATMRCQRCSFANDGRTNICARCGVELTQMCESCGTANPLSHAFCSGCGFAFATQVAVSDSEDVIAPPETREMAIIRRYLPQQLSAKILDSLNRIDGERKQVKVLFADMKGYTPLAEALGEEATYEVVDQIYERMITAVHREEGTVQELTGDGILALFGAPVTVEDAPLRACRTALSIQTQMQVLGSEIEAERGIRPQVRIGINTGPVVVAAVGTDLRTEYKAVGDTVNLAARLESMAEPGSIFISETTHKLVSGYVDSTFVGEREVKGKKVPQRVYCLKAFKPGMARFKVSLQRGLTPFAGREDELNLLKTCWSRAQQGVPQVALVVGEAGLGKSRLLHELNQRIAGEQTTIVRGHCTTSGRTTSFLPFIEVLRSIIGLGELDDKQKVVRKLRRGLERLGMSIDASLPFLINLLGLEMEGEPLRGLDGQIIGSRTRQVLYEMLGRQCHLSPVALVIEDLHWIDTASEEVLAQIVQGEERLPLLLVCSYRIPYRPTWAKGHDLLELRLRPLPEASMIDLVWQRLEGEQISDELARIVVEKAEGNPLFAEEILRFLLGRPHGSSSQSAEVGLHIPSSLQDLLLARVDRLDDGPRTLLKALATIGPRFSLELARETSGIKDSFVSCIEELEAHELIVRKKADDRDVFRFTHALIQEAVYGTLLTSRQRELHERAGEALERLYPDRLNEWAEELARHWSQTSNVKKSAHYLALAGEKSLRIYALDDADQRFGKAVALMEEELGSAYDVVLADVLLSWVRVFYYRKDFKGLITLINRYQSRIESLSDERRLSRLLFWLGYAHGMGARCNIAKPLLEKALALGESLGDVECIGYATMGLAWIYAYWIPRNESPPNILDQLTNRGLAIAEDLNDVFLASKCLVCLSIYNLLHGRFEEARGFCSRLQDLGQRARDPRTSAMAKWMHASVLTYEDRYDEALKEAEEAFQLSPDPLDRLTARGVQGSSLALKGQGLEASEILKEVRDEMVHSDYFYALAGVEMPYGVAQVMAGHMAAGVRWIKEANQRFSAWGNETMPVIGHMILGEIYLQMALGKEKPPFRVILRNLGFVLSSLPVASRKARRHLEEAVHRARDVDSPGYLARSLLDLGLLCAATKYRDEALIYLEEAHQIAEPLQSSVLSQKIRRALAA
jgi:class 3 adenylate cyclase/tetratricopeptide (TPR) repeat protein